MTPTQRTLKLLDGLGYKSGIVERWIPNPAYPGGGKRIDLWGIIDIIAINNRETVAVQSTGQAFSDHVRKIEGEGEKALLDWLAGPNRSFWLVAWRPLAAYKKDGTRAKADKMTPRVVRYVRGGPDRLCQVPVDLD